MPKGADEDFAAREGHGGTRLFPIAERVANRFEKLRAGVNDVGIGVEIVDIQFAVGGQETAPGFGAGEAGVPEVLTGFDFEAIGDAVLADEVAVIANKNGGADALRVLLLVMPKAMGRSDVA